MLDIKTILDKCQQLQRENLDVSTKVTYIASHNDQEPYVTFTVYFRGNGGSVKTSIFCDNAEKRLRTAEVIIKEAKEAGVV